MLQGKDKYPIVTCLAATLHLPTPLVKLLRVFHLLRRFASFIILIPSRQDHLCPNFLLATMKSVLCENSEEALWCQSVFFPLQNAHVKATSIEAIFFGLTMSYCLCETCKRNETLLPKILRGVKSAKFIHVFHWLKVACIGKSMRNSSLNNENTWALPTSHSHFHWT